MYMNTAAKVMSTQIQAYRGFKLFGQISVASIVKFLKN